MQRFVHRWLGGRAAALLIATSCALLASSSASLGQAVAYASPASADVPCPGGSGTPIYRDTRYSFAERAADLVSCMTLDQKVLQLRTNSAPGIPALGLQPYTYWSEGQHGINTLGANSNHGSVTGGVHATSFPTNFASTMSWDPSLVYHETSAISDEARGFLDPSLWGTAQNNLGPSAADYGDLTFWAPTVNMDRDPRWGRTDEAFGEDPFLVSSMAGAFVNGYQGNTLSGQPLSKYLKVAATAKHYALNNEENDRHSGSSDTTDANIRDYYTAQFRNLIDKDHVNGVMTSYNAVNGTPSPADTYTANELLQRTYGFNGYTTSDCGAVGDIWQTGSHDWAPPGWTTSTANGQTTWTNTTTGQKVSGPAGAQAWAARAGTDLNCTGNEYTPANIQEAIRAGVLSPGVIDNALTHVLTTRMETGEFDPRQENPYTKITKAQIQSPAHQALAQKVADESLVLLKNDPVDFKSPPLLPADPSKLNHVVIVGNLANTVTLGGYSGSPASQVSPVQGITDELKAANPNATVTFDACGTSTTATNPANCSAATQAAIKSADLVIVFVGTDETISHEGHDRASLAMPGNYDSLISQVAALGNPKMALTIQSDGPVKIDDVQQNFPAIVFSGYNGESQGTALADVLFGKQNPGGHLDFTWFKDDSQLPAISNYGLTPAQTGGLGRTYMYFTGTATYPFGYGLSYSQFRYSNFRVGPRSVSANGTVPVSFDVTNTGHTAGTTVAQLYVAQQFRVSGAELPKKRLAGFQKTRNLAPGQTQSITLSVKVSDLSQWDENALKQVVYDGPYQFRLATDATNVVDSATVEVHGAMTPHVQYVTVQPDQTVIHPGQMLGLRGKNHWIAPDTNPSLEQRHAPADNIVEAVNNDQSFVNLDTARVRYSSTNPRVASVTPTGQVIAQAAGLTTINVSVNGVTGSTPLVVQQPFSIKAPTVAQPGTTARVTTVLPNHGLNSLRDVTMSLTVPNGWTATAVTPTSFGQVGPGQTARTIWDVTVPADATPGTFPLSAQATFTDGAGSSEATATGTIAVPYAGLAGAFDNPGISNDSDPSAGNLDGGGLSYSAQALAAAGLTPGARIAHDGMTFTWPNAAPGSPDNVVASGQTIAFSGSGTTLGFLGTGDYGTATGTATVTYTDGTTQTSPLSFSDWYSGSAQPGGDVLATMPYHNNPTGQTHHTVSVYFASIPLQSGKTVRYVTLPNVSGAPAQNQVAMHIFAISTSCCSLSVNAPGPFSAGQSATVTGSLTNAGAGTVTDASLSLTTPNGWAATPSGSTSTSSLGAGQSLDGSWSVSVPSGTSCGVYPLQVTAKFTDPGGNPESSTQSASADLPCPSLAAAFDNVGTSPDSNPGGGNYDGSHTSYSANGLAASGLAPGGSVTADGVKMTWPAVATGQPDNVVAEGQTIAMSAAGSKLVFLGAGAYGAATGTGTIAYTDGSTQSFTLTLADWYNDTPQPGGTLVASSYRNTPQGVGTHAVGIYSATVPLQAAKTVKSVTLPAVSTNANANTNAMHIFDMGIG